MLQQQDELSEEDAENVQNLQFLFEELDLDVVTAVYIASNKCKHEAQEELGRCVQQPDRLQRVQATLLGQVRTNQHVQA